MNGGSDNEDLPIDPLDWALEELADGWTFLVTREAFFGARRFAEFAERLRIPRSRLSDRLKSLVDRGLFERRRYQENPPRDEYRFTEKGIDIFAVSVALLQWGDTWRDDGRGPPVRLMHVPCGRDLLVRAACSSCGETVHAEEVDWPAERPSRAPKSLRARRRRLFDVEGASGRVDSVARALAVVSDPWSLRIMARAVRGPVRFGPLSREIGIASNVLSERLRHLVSEEVLERGEGRGRGSTGYVATASGRDFLPAVLFARRWGIRWSDGDRRRIRSPRHSRCGSRFEAEPRCSACNEIVSARDVRVRAARHGSGARP